MQHVQLIDDTLEINMQIFQLIENMLQLIFCLFFN